MAPNCLLLFVLLLSCARAGTLSITHAQVAQYEDGPPVLAADTFTAGETVHFSFRADGYGRKEDNISLSFDAQPFDRLRKPLVPSVSGKVDTTLAPEDKGWLPKLRGSFTLPTALFKDTYVIKVRLNDQIANASAAAEIPFLVNGPQVEPSQSFLIQNLRFYRNEEDEKPLETAAYRVGEGVAVRFFLTGYKMGDDNKVGVSYGVKLLDPSGKTAYEQSEAAQDSSAEFYPKPFVPAAFSLSLRPGSPAGAYTLLVTARDVIGEQQTEARQTFRLE